MSFLPKYVCSFMTILSVISASDIPASADGKKSNVTSVTSVFLPPSPSLHYSKELSKTLSDEPSSIEYHQMDGPSKTLEGLQDEYEKLKAELKEKNSRYTEDLKDFNERKEKAKKDLATIVAKREELERKVEEERENLRKKAATVEQRENDLKQLEVKVTELLTRKESIEKKNEELQSLTAELAQLKNEVKKKLGDCIKPPPELLAFWNDAVHPDLRLCVKNYKNAV